MEIWKPVLGWEGLYEVSNWGRVRSCPRVLNAGRAGLREYRGKIVSFFLRQERRQFVNLTDRDKRATCKIHRLVLEAFAGPRQAGMECRHLDGNPLNNRLENLCWGTKLENEADKVRHGTARRLPLTAEEVRDIRVSPKRQQELASRYGVTQSLVSRIKSGERRL